MRRRRSKSLPPSVSLFPFLAVLICTLGVLIVILVLAVQSASVRQSRHEDAIAADIEKQEAIEAKRLAKKQQQRVAIEKLEDEIEVHDLQSEGFDDDRPRLRNEVAKSRDYRAHLEKELAELEEQAEQLVAEIKLLDSDLSSIETTVDDNELELLRQKISLAEKRLAEKRQNTVVITEKKFAIVPYRGNGGTRRVPVFVECNKSGLVLQPWNIPLTTADFFQPVAAGNPVDAALMAVRNYYQKYELADEDQRPYPLLVVRPEGAQSYGLARRSLVSWDDEFGYELVTNDKELDFGTVDPQLKKEVQDAVEQSKLNQIALRRRRAALMMARGGGSSNDAGNGFGGSGGLRSSASRGGFVRENTGVPAGQQNRQVGFQDSQSGEQGGESKTKNAQIASTFEAGSATNANATGPANPNASNSDQSSSGPNASGSNQPTQSIAATRGANWALPTQTDGATGYVRPVSMVCRANSISLKNVAGETVTISTETDPSAAMDDMVNVIWQRIDAWGIAGANAYWKPNLSVSVQPGARHRFEVIKQLLEGSGLSIEEVGQ